MDEKNVMRVPQDIIDKMMNSSSMSQMTDYMSVTSARQSAEVQQAIEERNRYIAKKDAAIFQAAEESKKQNKLLSEQIETLKEQNKLLKEMYEDAKKDSEENKKQAKNNKIFGWVSFAVGTIIGLAGVLCGIFL